MSDISEIYKVFLDSGELFAMLPGAKGEWEKDEKNFTRVYQENLDLLNDCDVDEPEEYYEE